MATHECKAVHVISPNQRFRQEQLLSLIAQICEPRHSRSSVDICRLVVDSRLSWGSQPIDARSSWLYLSQPAQVREVAGCLVLTAK